MKKVLSMALILMFVLSVAGCKATTVQTMGQSSSVQESSKQESSEQASSAPESSEQSSQASESTADKSSTDAASVSSDDKLSEIYDFATLDLWNNSFLIITNYISTGTDSDGNAISSAAVDKALLALKDAMGKMDEYDSYIKNLSDSKYDKVKSAWSKLSDEAQILDFEIQIKKPVAKDKSPKVISTNVDLMSQYIDDFTDAVDNLK